MASYCTVLTRTAGVHGALLLQVMDVIKKSGTTTQLGLIIFLMIVLVVLAVVAFM
jgi:hypothetical protein